MMRTQRSRSGIPAGLIAALGVFGAAAAIAAWVGAPSARADDFSVILADIQTVEADAATAFSTSATDFANNDPSDGLAQLFIGLDDDFVGVPDELEVGSVDAATNSTLFPAGDFDFAFATPATLAAAETEATTFSNEGQALAMTAAGLPMTDYSDRALDSALSFIDQWVVPEQILLIGEAIANGF
jgi:hypothetical protein